MVSKYKRESILPAMIMVLSNFLLKKNQRGGSREGSPDYNPLDIKDRASIILSKLGLIAPHLGAPPPDNLKTRLLSSIGLHYNASDTEWVDSLRGHFRDIESKSGYWMPWHKDKLKDILYNNIFILISNQNLTKATILLNYLKNYSNNAILFHKEMVLLKEKEKESLEKINHIFLDIINKL